MSRSRRQMAWSLRQPAAQRVAQFAASQSPLELTYPQGVQSVAGRADGFDVDHHQIELGDGHEVFAAACKVIANWRQMPADWIRVHAEPVPPAEGDTVVVAARFAGVWWLNACRIVDVYDAVDCGDDQRRYEVAYATLPGHAEQGEERFTIAMNASGRVRYEIRAVSRPRFWLARLAYPVVRRLQKRFALASLDQMSTLTQAATARPASLAAATVD